MKITVFTSNQPRHIALINSFASISRVTYAVQECNTVFPGVIQDFYKKSDIMRSYFSNVLNAEKKLFGDLSFLASNVRALPIKMGDVNFIQKEQLHDALNSDVYVVFGASYIKGWLLDFLISKVSLNIHMGLSPYYRGSSCNFWALYDNRPEYVGATIHLLSKELDGGSMLYHALPLLQNEDPFTFTMKAVQAAQESLVEIIASNEFSKFTPQLQDKSMEIRYTRNADFTDEVAAEYLSRNINSEKLQAMLSSASAPKLLHPFYA